MFQSVRPETEISGRVRITGKINKLKQIKSIDSPRALLLSREPVQGFGEKRPQEEGSVLFIAPWRIPRTEEPGGLQSMGSPRVGFVIHGILSPGKGTGVDCCFLLQGILVIQGSNPGLPHCKQMFHPLSHQGSPFL